MSDTSSRAIVTRARVDTGDYGALTCELRIERPAAGYYRPRPIAAMDVPVDVRNALVEWLFPEGVFSIAKALADPEPSG